MMDNQGFNGGLVATMAMIHGLLNLMAPATFQRGMDGSRAAQGAFIFIVASTIIIIVSHANLRRQWLRNRVFDGELGGNLKG